MARFGALLVLVVLVGLVVVPVLVVAAGSLWSATFIRLPGGPTLENYVRTLTAPGYGPVLWTTVQFTIGASFVAVSVGLLLAWIVARTDVPFRSVVRWLPATPILLSALVSNIGWILLYSPKTGMVNIWLMRLFGLDQPPFDIYSMAGLVTALGLHLVPIPYLIFLGPLSSMDRSLDEASRASGANQLRTLRQVTLPLLVPAILSSFTLAAILASHAFETPILLGLPAGIRTYMSSIYESLTAGQNYSLASAQAMIYLAFIGALLVWNRRLTKVEARFALITGKGSPRGVNRVGPWRWVLLGVVLLQFVLGFAQLLAANVYVSLLPFYTTTGPLPPPSFDNYVAAATTPRSLEAIGNSLVVAATVAAVAVLTASCLAFVAYKTRIAGRRLAEELGTMPVAFPPLVLSMALLLTLLSIPGLVILYNTVILLVLVLAVVFLPFALRVVGSTIISIEDQLLEASASSGAGTVRTLRSIAFPLMATAIAGAMAIVFVFSFRELGAVALITPPNMPLIPVHIYTLWQSGAPSPEVYALNIISFALTIAVPALIAGALWLVFRGVGRARAGLRPPDLLGAAVHSAPAPAEQRS